MLQSNILSLKKRTRMRGAALVEAAIALPVVLLIVLGTVHCSVVIREASIIVEGTRHGSRSAGAQSGKFPTLSTIGSITLSTCQTTSPGSANPAINTAVIASCKYILLSGLTLSDWNISVQAGTTASEGGAVSVSPYKITVTMSANNARGPVNALGLKTFLNMRPKAISVFPLEVL